MGMATAARGRTPLPGMLLSDQAFWESHTQGLNVDQSALLLDFKSRAGGQHPCAHIGFFQILVMHVIIVLPLPNPHTGLNHQHEPECRVDCVGASAERTLVQEFIYLYCYDHITVADMQRNSLMSAGTRN